MSYFPISVLQSSQSTNNSHQSDLIVDPCPSSLAGCLNKSAIISNYSSSSSSSSNTSDSGVTPESRSNNKNKITPTRPSSLSVHSNNCINLRQTKSNTPVESDTRESQQLFVNPHLLGSNDSDSLDCASISESASTPLQIGSVPDHCNSSNNSNAITNVDVEDISQSSNQSFEEDGEEEEEQSRREENEVERVSKSKSIREAMSGSTSPSGVATSPGTSCCDGGRPLVTDPMTGQTVCSCQYDPARLTLSSYPRLGAYGPSPYAPPSEQNPYPTLDSSAFYSPLGGAYAGLKEGSGTGDVSCWPNPGSLQSGYYPYDPTFAAAYGYGGGYDLAARRKNATRESTATLKAWLNEHKKNPYPTKGEKIMLAIITKMTLTQVSTWFANARRRLKKENKMTWEPKNKTDDDDEDLKDDEDDNDSNHVPSTSPGVNNNNAINYKSDTPSELNNKSDHCSSASKPKIWSLADTAACKTPPPPSAFHHHPHPGGGQLPGPVHGPGSTVPAPHYHHHSSSNQHNLHSTHPATSAAAAAAAAALNSHLSSHNHQSSHPHLPVPPHPHHHNGGGPPPPVTSSWGFPLPPAYRYSGFLPHMATNGEGVGVGTDTPPQTPPNLKVPLLPSSLSHFAPGASTASALNTSPELANTAFKPVLKSASGGFCV